MVEKSLNRTPRKHSAICFLRLIPEQRQRLEVVTKRLGKSMSDFARDAVMLYVSEIEEQVRVAKEKKTELDARAFVPKNIQSSRGLGIKLKYGLDRNSEEISVPVSVPVPVAALPTVIVQTAPTSPSGIASVEAGLSIDRCATYIIGTKGAFEGPFDRERRMRHVVDILNATAKSPDEVSRFAKALDDEIAKIEQKEKPKSSWFSRNK